MSRVTTVLICLAFACDKFNIRFYKLRFWLIFFVVIFVKRGRETGV